MRYIGTLDECRFCLTSLVLISPLTSIEPLQKTVRHIVDYLNATAPCDVALSGLHNWMSIKGRNKDWDASVFEPNGLIKEKLREQYAKKFLALLEDPKETGRAHDSMIMSVANDLVAQIEMAANFRKLKIGHHFAKSRYNIEQLGKGAKPPKNFDSILEDYTTGFIANAIKYIK